MPTSMDDICWPIRPIEKDCGLEIIPYFTIGSRLYIFVDVGIGLRYLPFAIWPFACLRQFGLRACFRASFTLLSDKSVKEDGKAPEALLECRPRFRIWCPAGSNEVCFV